MVLVVMVIAVDDCRNVKLVRGIYSDCPNIFVDRGPPVTQGHGGGDDGKLTLVS